MDKTLNPDYICSKIKQAIVNKYLMDSTKFEIVAQSMKFGFVFFYRHDNMSVKLPITYSLMKSGTICRIRIKNKYCNYLENVSYKTAPKDEWSRIDCDINDTEFLNRFEIAFSMMFADLSTKDIGCCSHYIECSDVKRCVSNNPEIFLHCYYKTNLENGKIFYGVNKNI